MVLSLSLFSGLSSVSTVPAGSLSKAAFTGANTVNGPALASEFTRSAALSAATSVVWSFEPSATRTTFGCETVSSTAACPPAAALASGVLALVSA